MWVREAGTLIDAPPDAVWAVLVDASHWPAWMDDVSVVDGNLEPGGRIVVHAARPRFKARPFHVTTFDPPTALTHSGRVALGLLRFRRIYVLSEADGATYFYVREEHQGPLTGAVARRTGELQPWFDRLATSLKERVESVPSPPVVPPPRRRGSHHPATPG